MKQRQASIIVNTGLIAFIFSPIVFYLLKKALSVGCERNRYGDNCVFEVDFSNTYTSLFVAIGWGIMSLVILCIGIYLSYQVSRRI